MKSFLSLALVVAATATTTGYHVIERIPAGGAGGWDYVTVDASARRLYASNSTRVVVVDVDSKKVVGEIADTPGVHGVALAPELHRGFTSNGRANNVTIFDPRTLAVLGQAKTGENPDAILYDAVSGRVFTFNGRSKDATVLDAKSGEVAATLPLGGKPEFAVADGKGKVYVNIEDTSELAEIDARKPAVTRRWSLAPCEEPSGLAFDAKHRRLFSVCGNKLMVVSDADSGKVLGTAAIGQGTDGAGFDPENETAFSSNGEGTLTLVRERAGKYEAVEAVATERGARTMAIDAKTRRIYLPTAEFGPTPAATEQQARPRPSIVPGTFHILIVGK
jgi:DNA-binding beta-propeller fold protein YncE